MSERVVCPCGAAFFRSPGRGRPRKKCESCAPRVRGYKPRPAEWRTCELCGSAFETHNSAQRFCGATCRDRSKYMNATRRPCDVCGLPTGTKHTDYRTSGPVRHRDCIPAPDHGTASRYKYGCRCSECRNAIRITAKKYRSKRIAEGRPIRRHGGSGPYIPESVRVSVYERDGYVCQLCGLDTDRFASGNDDWFPSLDHIVPKSLGGGHEVSNLRTAHRVCNSSRGARVDDAVVIAHGD